MSIVGSILGFVSAVLVKSALVTVGVLLVPRVNTRALPGAEGTASRSFCMLRGMKCRAKSGPGQTHTRQRQKAGVIPCMLTGGRMQARWTQGWSKHMAE